MDARRWSTFGEHETQILLLEKELREMGDVRDIASVEVRKNECRYLMTFPVAFNVLPEAWQGFNLYVDDEGYHRVQAFERDGHWHWCIRRMTIMDIVDFEAIREERLQREATA